MPDGQISLRQGNVAHGLCQRRVTKHLFQREHITACNESIGWWQSLDELADSRRDEHVLARVAIIDCDTAEYAYA